MAMKACKNCGKNKWDFVKIDNDPRIYCTCLHCGNKFSFPTPKKICGFCQKPADFAHIAISDKKRGKKCSECGKVKVLDIAQAYFRNVGGVSYRLEKDGLFHATKFVEVTERSGTGMKLIATNKILVEEMETV